MKRIVAIGSAIQDTFLVYEGADTLHLHTQKQDRSYLIFEQGIKIDIPALHYASGGGATNVAVGFRRLGLDVTAFYKNGDDTAGRFIKADMLKEKIDISHCIIDPDASTAISWVVPSIEHNHAVLCYMGTHAYLTKNDFTPQLLTGADYVFIGPLHGHSTPLLPFVAQETKKRGLPVAINPGTPQLDEWKMLEIALPFIDVIIVNTHEARILMKMLGKENKESFQSRKQQNQLPELCTYFMSLDNTDITIFDYFHALLQQGPSIAVVTNGAEGVYVATKNKVYFQESIKTNVIFGLGAGDAFSSGFVGALALGESLEMAILYGLINASSVIKFPDAKEGLLSLKELQQKALTIPAHTLRVL